MSGLPLVNSCGAHTLLSCSNTQPACCGRLLLYIGFACAIIIQTVLSIDMQIIIIVQIKETHFKIVSRFSVAFLKFSPFSMNGFPDFKVVDVQLM